MTFILEAAKGKNKHWVWYILGLVFIVFAYTLGQMPLMTVIQNQISRGVISEGEASDFYNTIDFAAIGIPSYIGLLLLLGAFVGALIGLYIYVVMVHGRKFRSLISSRPVRSDKIFFAFAFWFVLTGIAELVLYAMMPESYHFAFDPAAWLPLMLVVMLLLPLQTTFEEVLVRGYFLQRIGLLTKYPWIAVVITSAIFAAMHGSNPEIREFGLGVMMLYYFSVALSLAVITLLDDGLELALGIHAATNIYGAGFVTYKGTALQTEALIKVDVVNPVWMVGLFYVTIAIFIFVIIKKYGLSDYNLLFRRISEPPPLINDETPTEIRA